MPRIFERCSGRTGNRRHHRPPERPAPDGNGSPSSRGRSRSAACTPHTGPGRRIPRRRRWARTAVESTDTVQSMPSAASAAARIRSQVPSTAHLASRLCAVWNGPSSLGRFRQGELVRYFQAMASRGRRWLAHRRPRTGSAGIGGSIRAHITSVITNRTDASDQPINPSKRHALALPGREYLLQQRAELVELGLCEGGE